MKSEPKYKPTREDVLEVLRDTGAHASSRTLADVRRGVMQLHGLKVTFKKSERWGTPREVNPVSDTALRKVLAELEAEGTVRAFGVGEDPAVPVPYGTKPSSTLYLTTERYEQLCAQRDAARAQWAREFDLSQARERAEALVLAKYADEVEALRVRFLAEIEQERKDRS